MSDPVYTKEALLVRRFEECLNNFEKPFSIQKIANEFDYRSGRTDIIGISNSGELIAFEAKLKRWKDALNQAHKNFSFAHFSYVVLPNNAVNNALRQHYEFERRGVGLCSLDESSILIPIPGKRREPILPWLTESAVSFIHGGYDARSEKHRSRIPNNK